MKQPDWPTTLALVKRIIAARTVTKTLRQKTSGGSVIAGWVTRPFRESAFAAEVGVASGTSHGWLHYDVVPGPESQARIAKWCEKHKGVLK